MKRRFTILTAAIALLFFMMPALTVDAAEGDELAICQGTGSGYGTRRTLTDSHNVGWVLASGQTGYLGTNNATNHGNVHPTDDDIPVVKAVNQYTYTSTTGYYYYYTTTPVENVGSIEFSYTANSGNTTAKAYVVVGDALAVSGGNPYSQIALATSSTSEQGVSLGSSGTFTFTFEETQTSARYYGVIIQTNSYKRMTNGTIKLLEGSTISGPTHLAAPALTATPSNEKVTLTWNNVNGASSYTIQYADNSSFTGATTITNATSPKEISGLTNGTTYYFKAMSVGDGIDYISSDYGTAVSATPDNIATITITQDDIDNFTNVYAWYDWADSGVSGKLYAYKSGGMQFNSSKEAYWIYNTTAIPGNITSVKITKASGTDRSWTLKAGNSVLTTTSDGTQIGNAQTVGTNGAIWNVSGGYSYFLLYVSGGSTVISSIEITYTPTSASDPSISADDNVNLAFNETSGEIAYTLNNPVTGGSLSVSENVDWISNAVINTSENKVTFTTTANDATTSRSGVITITYTYGDNETVTKDVNITQAAAPLIYTTIPDLFNAATSTATNVNVTFGNWVVSGVSGSNVFVTDNNGNGFIIYKSNHGFVVNDKLSGTVMGTPLKLYSGSAEFTNLTNTTDGLSVSDDGTITVITDKTIADLGGVNTGAVITLNNLTYDGTNLSDGTNTIKPYTTLYNGTFVNGKTYNVTGVYQQFNSTKEILPRSAADIEEVVVTTPSITVTPDEVNVDAEAHDGTLELTYENLDITGMSDFDIQFFDENDNAIAGPDWMEVLVAEQDPSIGDGYVVSYDIYENDDEEAHIAYFKVWAYDDDLNEVYSNLVTINQAAPVAPVTGDKYVKVTSATDLTSGQYLIVYEEGSVAFDGSLTTLDAASNTISVVTNNNEIGVDNITTAAEFTIDVTNGTLKSASGKYIGVSSNSNGLKQTDNASTYTNSFSIDNNGNAVITAVFEGSNMTMRYNNASNQNRFRYYSNGQQAIQLYKKVVEPVTESFTKTITAYTSNDNGWYLIATPIGEVAPGNVANMIAEPAANYDLFIFDQTNASEWQNYKKGRFTTLEPGKGYLYANKNTVDLEFAGTAYTGEGTFPLVYSTVNSDSFMHGWNLMGNPYGESASVDRPYYTLNGDFEYELAEEDESVEAMEGIFVHVTEAEYNANQYVTFTPVSQQQQGGSKGSSLTLNLNKGGKLLDRAIVGFGQGHTLPKFQFNRNHTKVYIPQDGQDYAIVRSEEMGEMPVNFKAENDGTYSLSFSSRNAEFAYLHLIDNMTGADVDLLQTQSYSFEARMTDYESRFKLVFATGDNSKDDNFAFFSNGSFVINNEGNATLQVIDVTGRIISSESVNGCTNVNVNAAPGVYMLRLVNGENVRVQKVVVK